MCNEIYIVWKKIDNFVFGLMVRLVVRMVEWMLVRVVVGGKGCWMLVTGKKIMTSDPSE